MPFEPALWLGQNSYTPEQDRMFAVGHSMVEGVGYRDPVTGGGHLAVTGPATAGWTLTIATGWVYVQGDDDPVRQGLYAAYNSSPITFTDFPSLAPTTNPRIDAVYARLVDSTWNGAGSLRDQMYIHIEMGYENATATAANRNGAPGGPGGPAHPGTALHLADLVLTPAMTSGFTNAAVVDRRELIGPRIIGEDGNIYRLGIDASGNLGYEAQ